MANARQIVKRRKAVSNIHKIIKTMQLIATARFQQAYKRATATRPYTQKITQLVGQLSDVAEGQVDHKLLQENQDAPKDIVLVLSSSRGFCGGYNASILRTAMAHLKAHTQRDIALHVVGKKGIRYFKFLDRRIEDPITEIDDRPRYEQVEPLAGAFIEQYEKGLIGNVWVVYMRFITAGRQVPEVMRLLPLTREDEGGEELQEQPTSQATAQYDFSPPPEELLKLLLPQTVKV